jgi:hypothetical protein
MTATALEVRFRQDREHVKISRFKDALGQVATSLREIDRAAYFGEERAVWVVEHLETREQLLVVRLTARTATSKRDPATLLRPVEALVEGVDSLGREPEVPRFYSEATVSRLVAFGAPSQGLQQVSLATVNGSVGPEVPVSDVVLSNAKAAVRAAEVSLGSIVGRLDILNKRVRGQSVRASILDAATRRGVTVIFNDRLSDTLRNAWDHRVLVTGRVTRNERGQVVRIEADEIEQLPDDDSGRVDPDEFFGVDPEWLGGRSVDEYLREVRRG